ncbi:MAG TPA: RNA polymerase sigma factor [Planctomycetota bacterium]|nr:RNA polymerase sigma factor [Planctomycetota bacterium]
MAYPEPPAPQRLQPLSRFAATDWSLVLAAGKTNVESARPAMGRLLETYWYPLYAFVRRKGRGPEDACDLTQEFLARLLERNFLSSADPSKGKFRTFLLTALERFLVDELRREHREKRGGNRRILSLSMEDAEGRYQLEPQDTLTPQRIYERRWAITLLERSLGRLEAECGVAGRSDIFKALKPVLAGGQTTVSYEEIAGQLGMKEGAVKTAVHRLRRRFAALLRTEIAETVTDPSEVEEEVQELFRSLQ